MAIQKGIGRYLVKGVHGTMAFTGAVAIGDTNSKLMSASLQDDFSATPHRDGKSEVFAVTADQPIQSLSIRWVPIAPVGGTLANAKANFTLPPRLGVVTLTGFGNNRFDGTWHYVGGGGELSSDVGEVSMNLQRYGSDPEANSIGTAPVDFD